MPRQIFKSTGLIKIDPTKPDGRRTDSVSLEFERTLAQSDAGTVQVTSTDGLPYNLVVATITSVRLLFIRVLNGGTLKVLLTSAAGVDQAIRLSGEQLWEAPNAGDEFSAVKIVTAGAAVDFEYIVGGDGSAPAPPPPATQVGDIQLSSTARMQTGLLGLEEVLHQWRTNFDDLPSIATQMAARLSAIASVTGGSGTIRVRVGGGVGLADGTVILTSAAITSTSDVGLDVTPATVTKPTAGQLVKITGQNAAGQRTTLDGPHVILGAV